MTELSGLCSLLGSWKVAFNSSFQLKQFSDFYEKPAKKKKKLKYLNFVKGFLRE